MSAEKLIRQFEDELAAKGKKKAERALGWEPTAETCISAGIASTHQIEHHAHPSIELSIFGDGKWLPLILETCEGTLTADEVKFAFTIYAERCAAVDLLMYAHEKNPRGAFCLHHSSFQGQAFVRRYFTALVRLVRETWSYKLIGDRRKSVVELSFELWAPHFVGLHYLKWSTPEAQPTGDSPPQASVNGATDDAPPTIKETNPS